jgi:hypothetical protein
MPCSKVVPYWSKTSDVYHVCANCSVGNNIERDKLQSGVNVGNRTLCPVCYQIQIGLRPR